MSHVPWEYKDLPGYANLERQVAAVLERVRDRSLGTEVCADTRPVHGEFFHGMTPPAHPWFAGNYRGAPLAGLTTYAVRFGTKVGAPPGEVARRMEALGERIRRAIDALDQIEASDAPPVSKLSRAVFVVAALFGPFLLIHPYANGNGHMARFVVFTMLGRHGYWTNNWTVDPQPQPEDLYYAHIRAADANDLIPLVQHLMRCIQARPVPTLPSP